MSGDRYLGIARTHWADELPDWVELLARECDRRTQAAAAREMRCSQTLINRVLRRLYDSDYAGVERRVRGAFEASTVRCPVIGEISQQACLDHQRAPFAGTNNIRVRLYRACRAGCTHSRLPTRSTGAKE